MSRSKYTMTDAAAKRITAALHDVFKPGGGITIEQVEEALRGEEFYGSYKYNYVNDLVAWMQENDYVFFSQLLTRSYVREYYEHRTGVDELTAGLQRLGVIPYPEDSE